MGGSSSRTLPHHLPNHRLNQPGCLVLGAVKFGFEFVAEFHSAIDDNFFLF